ncbi:MAG: ribonuclease R [Candidatus Electrothrix sp. GW3-4]|uniref:ribonuclease R n=1 Tax=Candidatus Electrothrix sp. GW3-4 TaxID=3126740 RepID=UPI0030D391D3
MTKKKHRGRSKKEHFPRTQQHHDKEHSLSTTLLSFFQKQTKPVSLDTIINELAPAQPSRKLLKETLASLEKKGKLRRRRQGWMLAEQRKTVRATLSLTAKGFGFAVLEGNVARQQKDIFIPASALNGATHGDTVLVQPSGSPKRPEGEVVEVEKRAFTHVCGVYMSGKNSGYVTPDQDKLPFSIQVRRNDAMDADDGMAVRVEILDYGAKQRLPVGRVVEILGPVDSVQVQIRMAVEQFQLPRSFPQHVEQAAAALVPLTEPEPGRKDLRYLRHVTIDGATAKDFDDAIAVQKTKKGFRLFVSIADVSHYVRPGSAIDQEAYQRGTSVYLPDLVLPMLPERLSNDLCSLVPDQDRPAFTAILEFDQQGRRIGAKFTRSLIRSYQRFTYDTVHQAIYLREQEARRQHKSLLPMLEKAKELAALLQGQRMERGALGFTVPESNIQLEGDRVCSISRLKRNQAHLLIEEFMLAANEAVGATLDQAGASVLFRVHEEPDGDKVKDFAELAWSLGLKLPKTELTPSWFAGALELSKDSPTEYVVNNLLLRTMQRARYTPTNYGHFGLAAEYYIHFTSPIRRYPDLVAHRVMQHLLLRKSGEKTGKAARSNKGTRGKILPDGVTLEAAGTFLSARERVAVEAERDVQARLAALYLRDKVTGQFEAIISGVTSFGLFVELVDCLISGAIPVNEMEDDYYHYDSKGHKLVGERTGRVHRLGDLVRVQLDQVDMLSRKITFSLVGKGGE